MAITATGAEVLAERGLGSIAEPLPNALEDLMLTIQRPPVQGDMDTAVALGPWVGILRRIGAAKLNYWGLSAQVDNALLLISELVTNALKHGKGTEVRFRLILGTDWDIDLVVMEVDDGSAGCPQLREASLEEENGRRRQPDEPHRRRLR
ncbi:hypothetical protein ACFV2X_16715 [Streptomyces sp. NPDC059679]|uniref:hypothetical protein n=1 Tax=Streptomyces sp. NPDC059679 TaxID=3346903 RepID=UPI0036A7011B